MHLVGMGIDIPTQIYIEGKRGRYHRTMAVNDIDGKLTIGEDSPLCRQGLISVMTLKTLKSDIDTKTTGVMIRLRLWIHEETKLIDLKAPPMECRGDGKGK